VNIEVRLFANLIIFLPPGATGRQARLAVPQSATISALLAQLAIPASLVHLIAVNGRHQQDPNYVLQDGDVVSLFPPLAGGAPAQLGPFHVGPEAIDLAALSSAVADPAAGAIVTFAGVVRNNARGHSVTHLEYEAYTPMAEEVLAQIAREMAEKWDLRGVAMSHRVGRLGVGVASIGLAVSAAHRQDAFAACAYAMDRIKQILPVWKKEYAADGATWVEGPGKHENKG
jgi:molybdopterin synthase catalytic subunit/molybdopterin converting factor small subunit